MHTIHHCAPYDAAVLGAGASGLMCAMTAAARGRRVLLVDHGAKPGRKLSITGGGKCNLTNRQVNPADYAGENPDFCRSALARFTPDHLLRLVEDAGIALEEREHGQMFCRRSARDLVNLFVSRCRELGCVFAQEERILGLTRAAGSSGGDIFLIRTTTGVHQARNVVIATGGPAWPQAGGTGIGYELARLFGHRIVPLRPALAPLLMPKAWPLAGLAGLSVPATLRLADDDAAKNGRRVSHDPLARALSLLFTHSGISGPAGLQASLHWRPGQALHIDFLPEVSLKKLLNAPGAGKLLLRNLLRRQLPDRLCAALLPQELGEKKTAELSRTQREQAYALVHAHRITPTGTEGFAKAEVTAGGVDTGGVSSRSMQSAAVPGLFFCGEVLDVTGRLGGYNLHWAFASGKAAGEHID